MHRTLIPRGARPLLPLGVLSLLSPSRRPKAAPSLSKQSTAIRVRVRGGYEPSVIFVEAGFPLRLIFRREETAPCSERVVFPAFGKSAMLPPYEDVTVELFPTEPGEYEFTCQMGMLRGRVIVTGHGTGA